MSRIVVCLDVKDGRVVKGVKFEGLRDVGDPVELALRYAAEGADEIVVLDISATVEGRRTTLDAVRLAAGRLGVPLTVGGGIAAVDDFARALDAGATKAAINSAAVRRPGLLDEVAARFGSDAVVASIDAKWDPAAGFFRVHTHGGRTPTSYDAAAWARECEARGAGEILLTSIDRDGSRDGYDLELVRAVAGAVAVPVTASGGGAAVAHFCDAFLAGAAAVLAAGAFHDGTLSVHEVKRALAAGGLPNRSPQSTGP